MIVFLCAHVRIFISTYILTSIVTYLPYTHPLCKILNTPVMSICLVKQNDGTWVEKHQRLLLNVYKRFLLLSRFLRFLTFYIFSGTFFTSTMKRVKKMFWIVTCPISHRFRDKRRFPSKIANFSHPCGKNWQQGIAPAGIGYRPRAPQSFNPALYITLVSQRI